MKKIVALVLIGLSVVPTHAWAFLGIGDVVSDPMSYTYYVQQIKEMTEQTQNAIKQVETLGGIRTTAQDMYRSTVGTYNRGMGIIRDVERMKNRLNSDPSTLDGQFHKWSGVLGDVSQTAGQTGRTLDGATGLYVDARQVLDENFEDPRKRKKMMAHVPNMSKDRQYHVSQSALRDAVAAADEVLQTMPDRVSGLEDLVNQIDSTKNLKDAADLQNRFLAEILKTLYELMNVVSRIGEAQSLQFYQGVDDAAMENRIEATRRAAEGDPVWIHEQPLSAAGVHRVDGYYPAGTLETILNK